MFVPLVMSCLPMTLPLSLADVFYVTDLRWCSTSFSPAIVSTGPRRIHPEVEIWRYVEAPVLLGDEELGVADFVKIFQLEVEEMMVSRPAAGTTEQRLSGEGSQY